MRTDLVFSLPQKLFDHCVVVVVAGTEKGVLFSNKRQAGRQASKQQQQKPFTFEPMIWHIFAVG